MVMRVQARRELARSDASEVSIQDEIARKEQELDQIDETVPRKQRDEAQTANYREIEDALMRLKAQQSSGVIADEITASVGYEMWYFGVLLYQLCTPDGKTLWNADQADNIEIEEMQDLAFRWATLKESKLKKVAWSEARELIGRLLSEDAAERPSSWAEVLNHGFLTGDSALVATVKTGFSDVNHKLNDIMTNMING